MASQGDISVNVYNPYKPSVLLVGHEQNSANPDQTPQNKAADQGSPLFAYRLFLLKFK